MGSRRYGIQGREHLARLLAGEQDPKPPFLLGGQRGFGYLKTWMPPPKRSPSQGPVPNASIVSPSPQIQYRRALVIGNAAYPDSPLRNPVHDATDLADTLRRLNFAVTVVTDADKPTMERAIEAFTREAPPGSAGLFFFSGHGFQFEGVNYVPNQK